MRGFVVALTAGVLIASPLYAQQDPEPDAIIVTGTARDPATVRQDARLFARKVEAKPIDGQIARWNSPVCPNVQGVEAPVAAIVVKRIRDVAREAGVPVAADKCRSNIVVTFTPDASALVAALEKKKSRLLEGTSRDDKAAIRASTAPVRWWYATLTEGADGKQMAGESSALLGQNEIPSNGGQNILGTNSSSLIRTKFRSSIKTVVVLVDVGLSDGHRLSDVASYVAFVTLARIRVSERFSGAPSVLGMFGDDGAEGGLTDWDRAYLAGLYKAAVDRPADTQRGQIADAMAKGLEGD